MTEIFCSVSAQKGKTKLRFTCEDDIKLLKEAVANNPYENNQKWKIIYNNFIKTALKNFSLRAVKDHVEYLLTLYKKQDSTNLRKSGTAEMYDLKEQLLQELTSLKEEFKGRRNKKSTGEELRSNASSLDEHFNHDVEVIDLSPSPASPQSDSELPAPFPFSLGVSKNVTEAVCPCNLTRAKHPNKRRTIAEMLEKKWEKEMELEAKKLSLEEKRIELENRRVTLEEHKFDQLVAVQAQQQQLIEMLIKRLEK